MDAVEFEAVAVIEEGALGHFLDFAEIVFGGGKKVVKEDDERAKEGKEEGFEQAEVPPFFKRAFVLGVVLPVVITEVLMVIPAHGVEGSLCAVERARQMIILRGICCFRCL